MQRVLFGALFSLAVFAGAEAAAIPFDFSRGAIGLDVTMKGVPLHMILDNGVDPSVIDLKQKALDLPGLKDKLVEKG